MDETQYLWFKIFNKTEFDALGIPSKTYTLNLDTIGEKDVLVTKGNLYGITYEGVFVALNMNEKNPSEFDDFAIYEDADDNVYLGTPIDDD